MARKSTTRRRRQAVKLCPLVTVNEGLIEELRGKLRALNASTYKTLRRAAALELNEARAAAADAAAAGICDAPGSFYGGRAFAEAVSRALIAAAEEAKTVSRWFSRRLLYRISRDREQALIRAGVSRKWLRERWSVPLLRGQYISPEAARGLAAQVQLSAELITKMSRASCLRVQKELLDAVNRGRSLSRLKDTLLQLEHMDAARAARVALDQSCKLSAFIDRSNCKSLGIREGVWVHVPGQYSARKSHMAMNGRTFNLDQGLYDSEAGQYVLPAQLPFCRCIYRAVLPPQIMEEQQ